MWRAEHPTSDYVSLDVTEPLGLGWLATLPAPELIADPHDEDDPVDLSVTDSQISWTQPLRLTHTLGRHAPLPDRVVTHIRAAGLDGARIRLLLTHDGYELDPAETVQCAHARLAGKPRLEGIDWPIEFFPGILLTYTWSYGAGVLRATTTLLEYPVTVDGKQIEHRYAPGILTREATPGMDGREKTVTLAQRVLGAVRRLGLLDADGRATLIRGGVAAAVHDGHETTADKAALEPVIEELINTGHLRGVDGSVNEAGRVVYPAVLGYVRVALLVYEPKVEAGPPIMTRPAGGRALDRRFLRQHSVSPHLRRIAGQASEAQRRAYREDRARFGLVGPEELPPTGYTYIPSFSRGHR